MLSRVVLLLALSVPAAPMALAEPAAQASSSLSEASTLSLEGGSALVEGVAAGTGYVLVALKPLGTGSVAVFETTAGSATVTLELSGKAAEFAGKNLGAAVEVVAQAGGAALLLAGEMIAFVPDALSRSLHHRVRLSR